MSLFDLQDVCIAIGSLATLDSPMVVDLIGIYGLKGPYCTLTMTNWFWQALSVIPRGSWRDVAWATPKLAAPSSPKSRRRRRPPPSLPPPLSDRTCSDQLFEEFPSVLILSGLLVQADEGTLLPVVDLIRRNLPPHTVKCRFPRETGRSQVPRRQQAYFRRLPSIPVVVLSVVGSAELPSFSSFDYYPFEAVERLEEESVKLLVYEDFWRNLTAHPLALFEPFDNLYRFQLPGPSAVNCRSKEGSVSIRPCIVPEKSNAIIGVVTTGFECLPPSCDGLSGSEDHGPMISPVDTPCGYRG
ncbi:hypothetical protein F511_21834 [Dorcoceras hygrometricum]|uniref:Uncharacterized protein n=1 Tax=Dorcoceras hygrometricum TaxID=472368 RepID=A0A2Z7C9F2_9LAMI|nr:hypothetical protein F511_21834 [Dorcoceras hygrometricum]